MKVYIFCGLLLILGVVFYILYNRNTCRVIRTLRTDDGIIEIVNEECQEGLPHTTTMNIIRMTESVWNSWRNKETLKHKNFLFPFFHLSLALSLGRCNATDRIWLLAGC